MFILQNLAYDYKKDFDFINQETDKCLKYKERSNQNLRFEKIKDEILQPIKLTQSSAVFYHKLTNRVIKRFIKRKRSERIEELIATNLDHPNILSTYEVHHMTFTSFKGVKQDIYFLISEYLEIDVDIKKIARNEQIIKNICRDVIKGLKYLHDKDIAHLDLKMGNIMGTDKKGKTTYKIIDFGFARTIKDDEYIYLENKYYGTYPFSPPEIYNDGIYSKKSDVWCLGAMAYFLITDKKVFYHKGSRNYDEYENFLKGRRKFYFGHASDDLKEFIQDCMKINFKERPSVDELLKYPFIKYD